MNYKLIPLFFSSVLLVSCGTKEHEDLVNDIYSTEMSLIDFDTEISKFSQRYARSVSEQSTRIVNLTVNERYDNIRDTFSPELCYLLDSLSGNHNQFWQTYSAFVTESSRFGWINAAQKVVIDLAQAVREGTIEDNMAREELDKLKVTIQLNQQKTDSLFGLIHENAVRELILLGAQVEAIQVLVTKDEK